jgi:hypothetical protein
MTRIFATRYAIGFRALGWQFDYRPDGHLPFSIRHGKRKPAWKVLHLGRLGCLTAGRVVTIPAEVSR